MGKRFTATEKWVDKWFRSLLPNHKIGWYYLCDNCDAAGVIDLDRDLADFQIGEPIDWDELLAAAGNRIEVIQKGKLWLTGFIEFQYGELSEECSAHKPVFRLLVKYALLNRVLEGYQKAIHSLKDKDKEEDKEEDKETKGGAGGKTTKRISAADIPLPDGFEIPEVLQALADWLSFKAKRGESYKDAAFLGRKLTEFSEAGPTAFVAAVYSSIGNNYGGIFPAKDFNGRTTTFRVGAGQRYRGDE